MGVWRAIVKESRAELRGYSLSELGNIVTNVRDMVMNNLEAGMPHIWFELGIKLVCWEQMPFTIHCLN